MIDSRKRNTNDGGAGKMTTFLAVIAMGLALTACTGATTPSATAGYRIAIIPECRGSAAAPVEHWARAGKLLRQGSGPICTEGIDKGAELRTPLKIHPYKGIATISFQCDAARMASFQRANGNRWGVVTAGDSALQRVMLFDQSYPSTGCELANMTIEEAIMLCIDFSDALKTDPTQCASLCRENKDGWACIGN